MSFVLYGSFNRPYSFLASLHADRLAAAEAGLWSGGRWSTIRRCRVNTAAAIAGYPALHGPQANRQHAALPEAFRADGLDIGNRAVPGRFGWLAVSPGDTMRGRQQEWEGTGRRVMPMMALPDERSGEVWTSCPGSRR